MNMDRLDYKNIDVCPWEDNQNEILNHSYEDYQDNLRSIFYKTNS